MRPPYDDLDGYEFADSLAVRRILREQRREELRFAKRRGPRDPDESGFRDHKRNHYVDNTFDDDYEDYEDYDEYNDDEFDSYSGISTDH